MAIFSSLSKQKDLGLLILRVGVGAFMILHGLPKLMGGPDVWNGVGKSMGNLGVTFIPVFWGFMAAITETIGGLFLLMGLWYWPVCILLAFTMLVAGAKHLSAGDGWGGASHALELMFVYIGLIFIGPGSYSVDKK